MGTSKDYIIQFSGLAVGEHLFEITIDDTFFDSLAYSEIKRGTIKVNTTLLKRSNMLVLTFEMGGTVKTNCDRCAGEFDLPISRNYKLIVKLGNEDMSGDDDDIISIGANESKLDLSQYLYEYIMLSLPYKREHMNIAECDKEVLGKLNNFLIEEEPKERINDSRWDELKKIKLN